MRRLFCGFFVSSRGVRRNGIFGCEPLPVVVLTPLLIIFSICFGSGCSSVSGVPFSTAEFSPHSLLADDCYDSFPCAVRTSSRSRLLSRSPFGFERSHQMRGAQRHPGLYPASLGVDPAQAGLTRSRRPPLSTVGDLEYDFDRSRSCPSLSSANPFPPLSPVKATRTTRASRSPPLVSVIHTCAERFPREKTGESPRGDQI